MYISEHVSEHASSSLHVIVIIPCLKNVPPLACYNFHTSHERILIFFGRNITDKVGNQDACLK